MRTKGDVYRDTGVFAREQWMIEGYDFQFTTERDAKEALKFASLKSYEARDELAAEITKVLP